MDRGDEDFAVKSESDGEGDSDHSSALSRSPDNSADSVPGRCKVELASETALEGTTAAVKVVRRRKSFSVCEKLAMLAEVDSGRKKVDICREYGISSSTLSTFVKNRDAVISAFNESRPKAKRLRKSIRSDVDAALLRWFHQAKASGIPISGPLLQAKAQDFARQFNYEDCSISNAWIDRFKKRHNLTYRTDGWSQMGLTDVDAWLTTSWPQIRAGYPSWDVFSAVETGLFFRILPPEAETFHRERCQQGQLAADRITVLVIANMVGDEKRPLVVVGRHRQPACFEGVTTLPVTYEANERCWMTQTIFFDVLKRWDAELAKRKRKVLLLVDQCPAHVAPSKHILRNIELVNPPPNTAGALLPMDRGVVQGLKRYYRKIFLVNSLEKIASRGELPRVRILDAIRYLSAAWHRIPCQAIRDAFRACGLSQDEPDTQETTEEDDIPLDKWGSRYDLGPFANGLAEYESVDEALVTSGKLAAGDFSGAPVKASSRVPAEEVGEIEPKPALSEAIAASKVLTRFCETTHCDRQTLEAVLALKAKIELMAFEEKRGPKS